MSVTLQGFESAISSKPLNYDSEVSMTLLSHNLTVFPAIWMANILAIRAICAICETILGSESVAYGDMLDRKTWVRKSRETISLRCIISYWEFNAIAG